MQGYTNITIAEKVIILKQLQVWRKMNDEEKKTFKKCKSEFQADRLMRDFRSKYLN